MSSPVFACTPSVRAATRPWGAALVAALLLVACGGGDGGSGGNVAGPASCSVADQQSWLVNYLDDAYFWYAQAPRPDPSVFTDVESFFQARLYDGSDSRFPRDRWSGSSSSESFSRFYGEGATMGYGLSVAGLELERDGSRPLFVRYVEPLSPAATQGVQRGDEVLAINGRSAGELIAADDFAALTASAEGERLTLELRRAGASRSVVLTAAVFTLTPVQGVDVITTPGGRRLGVLMVKDMISQSHPALEAAFARFRSEGVNELVLDIRYNGGGLVSTGNRLASHIAGGSAGRTYALLRHSDKQPGRNQRFAFEALASSLNLTRVLVLQGRRTCSASEQVVNALRGVGLTVELIGEASCGKPVGFVPVTQCSRTWSVVNFESVNERGEGRYWDGFVPTCAVAERFDRAARASGDPLFDAALARADGAACPVAAGDGRASPLGARPGPARVPPKRDEPAVMLPW
jgi:carboxyl-terminal processing protease